MSDIGTSRHAPVPELRVRLAECVVRWVLGHPDARLRVVRVSELEWHQMQVEGRFQLHNPFCDPPYDTIEVKPTAPASWILSRSPTPEAQ